MKAIKDELSIAELNKLLALWRSRGIKDVNIPKLERLYLGATAYMDASGGYPMHNLYELATSVGFRTVTVMLAAVRQCTSFIILENPKEGQPPLGFCSPLWYNKNVDKPKDSSSANPQPIPASAQMDNIYNIYTKGGVSPETPSPKGDAVKKDNTETVREFFHQLNTNEAERTAVLMPLIDHFQKNERLTRENARQVVVCLVNEKLVPYFAARPRFFQIDFAGRKAWLVNLLKSAHGERLKNEAARACRVGREESLKEVLTRMRIHRPLSPHEWMHPETGQRYYDDDVEGALLIPPEAEPRPTETAVWNELSKSWNQINEE